MEELNPERQNAINSSIDATNGRHVIDSFIRRPQETTEALVNTFTYFKMDNVKEADSKKKKSSLTSTMTTASELQCGKTENTIQDVQNNTNITNQRNEKKTDEDGIEEELLEEGTKSGAMTSSDRQLEPAQLSRPQRKFGNFLDEANSDDDDAAADSDNPLDGDTVGGGYSASFAHTEQTSGPEGEAIVSGSSHTRKIENLPHTTQQTVECDLSALVDAQYEDDGDDDDDGEGGDSQLNPGEVEDLPEHMPSLSDLEQVTCLPITTTRDSSKDNMSHSEGSVEICTDEVEPFKLDEDFDYDNVKLTPKFTTEELEYLKSFIPTNSDET